MDQKSKNQNSTLFLIKYSSDEDRSSKKNQIKEKIENEMQKCSVVNIYPYCGSATYPQIKITNRATRKQKKYPNLVFIFDSKFIYAYYFIETHIWQKKWAILHRYNFHMFLQSKWAIFHMNN